MSQKPTFTKRDEGRGTQFIDYWPLVCLIAIAALAAWAINRPLGAYPINWMHYFMGFFLCQFAMLKLFHPSAFANGFEMYDLLAKRSRSYALAYPWIELLLGLFFLTFFAPYFTYLATAAIMIFGSIGVIGALRRGLDINCPCMGSILDVPLSTVTLTEDLGMAALSLVMFFAKLL